MHVFSKHSNVDVLEEALIILSRSSMTDINVDYDTSGPCDVYFHEQSTIEEGHARAVCVYRNVILEVNVSAGDIDVRSIVESLYMKMKEALVDSREVKRIEIAHKLSSDLVAIEQEFDIELDLPDNNPYTIKLHRDFSGNLELVNIAGNKFTFRAKNKVYIV